MKMKASTQAGKTFYSVGLESVNSLIMHVRDKKCIVPTAEVIQKMRRGYPSDVLLISLYSTIQTTYLSRFQEMRREYPATLF